MPTRRFALAGWALCTSSNLLAQGAPPAPDRPWVLPNRMSEEQRQIGRQAHTSVDPGRTYSLPDLIDVAERHNPTTRAAWENARATAARLGVARSELLPNLTAVAMANTTRDGVLLGNAFVRQTLGLYQPMLQVSYLALDFGDRSARIDEIREQLVAANLNFNQSLLDVLLRPPGATTSC